MMFDLTGKTAIVTGGRDGLGRSMVQTLAGAGCNVVIIDVACDTVAAAQQIEAGSGRIRGIKANLLDRTELRTAFAMAVEMLGGVLDILVTSAGVRYAVPALDHDMERWDRTLELNVSAVFECCQIGGKLMTQRGCGSIINLASIRAFVGSLDAAAYGTSKGAIAAMTRSLSNEWARLGVRVNAIAPGYILTALSAPVAAKADESAEVLKRVPAGRWGTPADLAGLTLLLASDASTYITGTVIPCDGGFLAR
ncbi:SDR family oxidoreductase [Xanthobacter dioxanivorans]|uniref:SDR family oxidoreductase n=1 Tax=Xanthobacter dioxanivorans TaxID=2528964 RepID=A0A974PJ87_9HYPH|nr:SDR family oxidoreductase [Xanthobacter dioxanivorans]QRG04652.1 SDR family oxidoreductase [Xanthobacter dioxanivorans]